MSGDRLAQFQENIDACNEQGGALVFIGVDFAQDVLDVAKAARDLPLERLRGREAVRLHHALARLDSGAAEERT